ncbi:MAG: hypothetical protein WD379_06870 [Dehalococcoidia bacterium]
MVLGLAACSGSGGGEDEESEEVVLFIEADLGDETADIEPQTLMESIAAVLERRAEAFGAKEIDIQIDGTRLTATLGSGMSADEARQVFLKRGILDIRQPFRNPEGNIVCQPASGERFAVPTEAIAYDTSDPAARPLPRCAGEGGQTGDIVWASPANPGAEATVGLPLAVASAEVDRTQAAAVFITLDSQGTVNLQQITAGLLGFPLGIFVDGELMAGPTVEEAILDGLLVIAGLPLPAADILAAQIGSGSIPFTLTEAAPD